MIRSYNYFVLVVLSILLWCSPTDLHALTAQEILDQSIMKRNLGESFRIAATVKTYKAKKLLSDQTLWLMAQIRKDGANFFVDLDSPPQSKGMRFLLLVHEGNEPQALMYLPVVGKSVPLAAVENIAKIVIQGLIPKSDETAELVKEEAVDGRDCYVIRIKCPGESGERLTWISKKHFLVVKSQEMGSAGKVKWTFRVVEFFKTEQGEEFPREEEILIPDNEMRIRLRQDSAVFGIEIPDEVMNPETFGTFKWRV
ncbi:MAG: outer membrane lipoprotein-sorting protein [Desulfomonilaceae bacterium]